MANLSDLEAAFIKADDAAQKGDATAKDDAAYFASEIRKLKTPVASNDVPTPGQSNIDQNQNKEGLVAGFVRGVSELPRAIGEIPLSLASGMVAPAIGSALALGRQALGGGLGNPAASLDAAQQAAEFANKYTYEPRTQTGKEVVGMANAALGAVAPALPAIQGEMAAFAARPQIPSKVDIPNQQALINAGNDARRLEAIQTARKYNLKLNPINTRPTAVNELGEILAGPGNVSGKAYEINRPIINSIARAEAKIPEGIALGPDSYKMAEKIAAKPYDEVRTVPRFYADKQYAEGINRISSFADLPEAEQALLKKSPEIAELLDRASIPEFTGKGAVEIMKQLREDANRVLRNPLSTSDSIALADVKRSIAKQIESMVDRNLARMDEAQPGSGYGDLLNRFQEGRKTIAKIKTLERATDNAGNVDVTKFKTDKRHTAYSEGIKDLYDISSIPAFTESFVPPERQVKTLWPSKTGAVSQLLHWGATPIRKGLLSEYYQNRSAELSGPMRERFGYSSLPQPEQLQPPSRGVVPYVSEGQVFARGEDIPSPNWVPGRNTVEPDVQVVTPQQKLLEQPSYEKTVANINQRRAHDLSVARDAAAREEAWMARQEDFYRQPIGRGTPLEFDPVMGRLRPADQGLKGATPDVIASTGHELNSAVGKISRGENATLTATEKIAWEKSKVDLSIISGGMNKLSDRQIAGKMMDRQWVADAIQKARDQAAGFDEISKRAKDAQTIRNAVQAREKMLDMADLLEEQMRPSRPIPKTTQGKKTREAIRNGMINGIIVE